MTEMNLIPPGHGERVSHGHFARCPECATVLDAYPASRADGRWEGKCAEHGHVGVVYGDRDDILAEARSRVPVFACNPDESGGVA